MKKKLLKNLLFFIISFFMIFSFSLNINALTKQTDFISLNDEVSLEIDNIILTNIKFNTTNGLTAKILNNSKNEIDYSLTTYYYDSNYVLLGQNKTKDTLIQKNKTIKQQILINNLNTSETKNDIKYYRIALELPNNDQINNTPSQDNVYNTLDYVIDKYEVNINVNDNKCLNITEKITVFYNKKRQGINIDIPLINEIKTLDGTIIKEEAKIKNIELNTLYNLNKQNNYYTLEIGSTNEENIGSKTYIISYDYNYKKDKINGYDLLYYNMINSNWTVPIGNLSFKIKMPKDFDNKINFSIGEYNTNNENIKYTIRDNLIEGSYDGIIDKKQEISFNIVLPDNYFKKYTTLLNTRMYLMFIVPILGLIISSIVWFMYGRNNKKIESISYYPPREYNSLEASYIFNRKINKKQIASLLLFLSNKGYITIENKYKNYSVKKYKSNKIMRLIISLSILLITTIILIITIKKELEIPSIISFFILIIELVIIPNILPKRYFILKKDKNYKEENLNENDFLEFLFNNKSNRLTRIKKRLKSSKNKNKYFKNNILYSLIIIVFIIASIITTYVTTFIEYSKIIELLLLTISVTVSIAIFISVGNIIEKIIYMIIFNSILVASLFISGFENSIIFENEINIYGFIIGTICIIGIIYFLCNYDKRTKYGNDFYIKVKEFKNFIKKSDTDILKSLLEDNPNYLYDTLPYAYALGLSNKWIKKFKDIKLNYPTWYQNNQEFNIELINSVIKSSLHMVITKININSKNY